MLINNKGLTAISFGLLLSLNSQTKASQPTNQSERYQPSFFVEYSPQTALDMVKRLPGFILAETDNDIRGFAQGAGNVLIDGNRPTTKSGGIQEALSRIPTTQVAYIEILRGNTGSADTQGQSVVANIVRVKNSAAKRWQIGLIAADDGKLIAPSGELSISQQLGDWDSAFKINALQQKFPRYADIERYDANERLTLSQKENRPTQLNELFLSGDATKEFEQQQLRINARAGWSQYIANTNRLIDFSDANLTDSQFDNDRDSQYYTSELGINYLKSLNSGWQWQILNLNNNQNWFVTADSVIQAPIGTFDNGSRLRFDEHKSENILRTTWSYKDNGLLARQEYGAEVAYSRLESWLNISSLDHNLQAINLNRHSYSKATEKRSEIFSKLTWKQAKLTVETGLAAEHSEIDVSGDSQDTQSLFFIKPSLNVSYDLNDNTQYRFNLFKSVGQLDFSDFAASADLVNDRQFSGNSQLKPDTKVRADIGLDYRFLQKGAIALELYHEWRSDVLEQILLPSGAQGLGNAGDAKVKGIKLTTNLPLDKWISQGIFTITADFANSKFDDPVTGQTRELTYFSNPNLIFDFRQALSESQLSWGLRYQGYVETEEYYVNEYNYFRTEGRWSAFIEGIVLAQYKWILSVVNLTDERQRWDRKLYQGGRNGALNLIEKTQREQGPHVQLRVIHAF